MQARGSNASVLAQLAGTGLAGRSLQTVAHLSRQWWVRLSLIVLSAALNGRSLWAVYQDTGLLNAIGIDYKLYYLMARAFWSDDPGNAYHPSTWVPYLAALRPYYAHADSDPAPPGLVLYPPLFPWAFRPFLDLSPHVGFFLWTALNIAAAAYLTWRVAQRFPRGQQFWIALLLWNSLALWSALVSGQIQVLLACAFAESYLALRAGHDASASFWLGWLLVKPQYGVLLGLVLVWKRRWRVVVGVVGVGLLLLGSSLLVAGLPALIAFMTTAQRYVDFSGTLDPYVAPQLMLNWRALVLYGLRTLGDEPRLWLTLVLSLGTTLGALALWRGPWRPTEPNFPAKMTVLMLATILTAYHSHSYGPLLLLMPLADLLVEWRPAWLTRLVIVAAAVGPMLMITVVSFNNMARGTLLFTALLLACYGCLLVEFWRRPERGAAPVAMREAA